MPMAGLANVRGQSHVRRLSFLTCRRAAVSDISACDLAIKPREVQLGALTIDSFPS